MTTEEKKSNKKQTVLERIKSTPKSLYNTLCTFYEKIIKHILEFLWFVVKISVVVVTYFGYLFLFSELVIRGVAESSAIHLAGGIGGYIIVGIVTLLLIYDYFFNNEIRYMASEMPSILSSNRVSSQIESARDDIRVIEIKSKLYDMERGLRDEIRSLKE